MAELQCSRHTGFISAARVLGRAPNFVTLIAIWKDMACKMLRAVRLMLWSLNCVF